MKVDLENGIYLGLIEKRHAASFYSYIQDNMENFRGILSFIDRMSSVEAVEEFIKTFAEMQVDGTGFLWGIWENGTIIGSMNAHDINPFLKIGEVSYFIDKSHEGKGIIGRAFEVILEELFEEYSLQRVFLRCATENTRSQSVAKRHGLKYEGTERRSFMANGKMQDLMIWSMLREEYDEKKKSNGAGACPGGPGPRGREEERRKRP